MFAYASYAYNTLPLFITIPLVFYTGFHHYHQVPYNITTSDNIKDVAIGVAAAASNIAFCNCTPASKFCSNEEDIMSKLVEINIPEDSRRKVMDMLDKLEWLEVQPSSCISSILAYSDSIHNIIQSVVSNPRMIIQYVVSNPTMILLAIGNLFSIFVFHLIFKYSIFGVALMIVKNRISRFISSIQLYIASSKEYFKTLSWCSMISQALTTYDSTTGSAVDDLFLECSSVQLQTIATIASEELLAIKNQDEEKVNGNADDYDNGYESFMQSIHADMNRNDSAILNSTRCELLNEAAGTRTGAVTPEKFKKFLHRKSETVGRMGISFSEEGYLTDDEDMTMEDFVRDGDDTFSVY